MWKKSRVLFLAMVQSDVHQCTRRLVLPLGVTSESPARVAACIALLIKLVCESITHCALSLSTPGADPGFKKRGGGSNIFDVAKYIGVLEVGGWGVECMSTLRHSYRDSVIFVI